MQTPTWTCNIYALTGVIFSYEKRLGNFSLKLTAGEEARRQLHKNFASNIEQVLAATPNKASTIRPPASHHENYSS